jgi:integrase
MPRPSGLRIEPRRNKTTGKADGFTIVGTVAGVRIRRRAESTQRALAAEEAKTLETRLLRDAWHGESRGARSLGEAILAYLDHAPRAEGDKRRLARILTALGDIRLAAIDQSIVDRCRRKLLAADASPATVRRGIITPLRAVMMHAAKRKWCDRPEFDIPREIEGRTRYLLPAQAERLIAVASPHIRTLMILLLTTGMRMSEALELRWQDVDLAGGRAILWPDQTKAKKRRNVSLPPRVVAALANLPHREGPVIRRDDGQPYADRRRQGGGQVKTAWTATLKRAGLDPAFTPHTCRHTWASWFHAIHHDLLALKVEGGWSSVTQVERYAHLMPAGHEAAIRAFWHLSGIEIAAERASA